MYGRCTCAIERICTDGTPTSVFDSMHSNKRLHGKAESKPKKRQPGKCQKRESNTQTKQRKANRTTSTQTQASTVHRRASSRERERDGTCILSGGTPATAPKERRMTISQITFIFANSINTQTLMK